MGSHNGAEICELVGLHILEKLLNLIGRKNVGLYRDDELAVINNSSEPTLDFILQQKWVWKSKTTVGISIKWKWV